MVVDETINENVYETQVLVAVFASSFHVLKLEARSPSLFIHPCTPRRLSQPILKHHLVPDLAQAPHRQCFESSCRTSTNQTRNLNYA